MFNNPKVAIYQDESISYPINLSYNAPRDYPEYVFKGLSLNDPENKVYNAVRESFILLGLDKKNFNTTKWNPLGTLIQPGNTVLIKPNAVQDYNNKKGQTVFASITHFSLIRPIVDYAFIALKGIGKIIIADAPMSNSNWENWKKIVGVDSIVRLYKNIKNFNIEVYDLRYLVHENWTGYAASNKKRYAIRDPLGYLEYDLGRESEFEDFSEKDINLLYGSEYNRRKTVQHHLEGHHKYCIAKSILNADVIISIPKLKVHQKVGITLNIKGMVGAMGDKNYIPHYRIGDPSRGGDEYPNQGIIQNALNRLRQYKYINIAAKNNRLADFIFWFVDKFHVYSQKILKYFFILTKGKKYLGNITGGSWYGNDTTWRMSLDLNHLVYHLSKDGKLSDTPKRKFLSIIDGIIGGERDGPLAPTEKKCGVIITGFNPISTDMVASRLMGFDPLKIKTLSFGLKRKWLKSWSGNINEIPVISNIDVYNKLMSDNINRFLDFKPHFGWKNHIEI